MITAAFSWLLPETDPTGYTVLESPVAVPHPTTMHVSFIAVVVKPRRHPSWLSSNQLNNGFNYF